MWKHTAGNNERSVDALDHVIDVERHNPETGLEFSLEAHRKRSRRRGRQRAYHERDGRRCDKTVRARRTHRPAARGGRCRKQAGAWSSRRPDRGPPAEPAAVPRFRSPPPQLALPGLPQARRSDLPRMLPGRRRSHSASPHACGRRRARTAAALPAGGAARNACKRIAKKGVSTKRPKRAHTRPSAYITSPCVRSIPM